MPVLVTCACGKQYSLKDELAGRQAKCPACGCIVVVPETAQAVPRLKGYEIYSRLGDGGMGVVWKGLQLTTRRLVAIRFLRNRSFGSGRSQQRFERLVHFHAKLTHPAIVRVYERGLWHGLCYYATELIDGIPLDQYVKENKLEQKQILKLIEAVCQAVQYAHEHGVLHGDLKPSSILVSKDGRPHILDFGLAKVLRDEGGSKKEAPISLDGPPAGTPECLNRGHVAGQHEESDNRTDVRSLGLILYRLMVGESPREFGGASDDDLEGLLRKALSRSPEDGYATPGELDEDIDNYLHDQPLMVHENPFLQPLAKRAARHWIAISVTMVALVVVMVMLMGLRPGGWIRQHLATTSTNYGPFKGKPWEMSGTPAMTGQQIDAAGHRVESKSPNAEFKPAAPSTPANVRSGEKLAVTTVTGKVVDANGRPVAGAEVVAWISRAVPGQKSRLERLTETRSQTDGVFSMSFDSFDGSLTFLARKAGLSIGWTYRVLPKGPQQESAIALAAPVVLAGTVVDELGRPLSGVEVRAFLHLQRGDSQTGWQYLGSNTGLDWTVAHTNNRGEFILQDMPADATADFLLRAPGRACLFTHPGYPAPQYQYRPGQANIRITLPLESRLEGVVVEKNTGRPLPGVEVTIAANRLPIYAKSEGISGPDGRFAFDQLTAGTYTVALFPEANGFLPLDKAAEWVSANIEVPVAAGQTRSNLRIEAAKGGLLEFRVLDSDSGRPVVGNMVRVSLETRILADNLDHFPPDAMVSMTPSGKIHFSQRTVRLDAEGRATIRLLPGQYAVTGVAPELPYSPIRTRKEFAAVEGQTERVEIKLAQAPKITVLVTDPDGRPVAGIKVRRWASRLSGEATTDAFGRAELSLPTDSSGGKASAGSIWAQVADRNLVGVLVDLAEQDDHKVPLELKLASGLILTGTVVDPQGHPLAGVAALVSVEAARGETFGINDAPAKTDAQGRYEIRGLPLGQNYTLRVNDWTMFPSSSGSHSRFGGAGIYLDLAGSTAHQMEVDKMILKPATGSISGTVVDASGKPVPRATVRSMGFLRPVKGAGVQTSQPNILTTTDEQGHFTVEGLCPGPVQLFSTADVLSATGSSVGSFGVLVLTLDGEAKDIQIKLRPRGEMVPPSRRPARVSGPANVNSGEKPTIPTVSPASIEPGIFPKLAFARSIIDEIPTGTQTLSEEQAGGLRAAGKTIDSALAIKPNDSAAVDLKNKIEELLKKPIATMLSLQNLDRLTELLKQRDILAALILRDKMGNADVHDLSITTKLRDIDQQLKDEAERQQVQRSEGYLWAHQPAAQSADWSKALAGGRGRKTRRAFLCIRMENPDREDYFNVVFSNGIVCFRLQDSGTGGAESIHSGECILAGSYQDAHHGQISIETVSHACPRIMIDLPDEGAATAGEILVRAVPVSEMGRLEVDVLPESGLSLAEGRLHVGRRFAPYQSGKPIDPKGHCLMLMMAAGPVQVYVDGGKQLSSIRQQAQIKAGELTKVELKVYSRRIVVFDWKYRLPAGEGEWKTGTTTLLTGDWAPLNNWGVNGSVYALGDWNGTTAGISGVNGSLVPAEPADYTDSQIRATTADWGRADRGVGYPLAVGKAFAVSYGHGKDRGEALMLVRSIRSAIGENGDKP